MKRIRALLRLFSSSPSFSSLCPLPFRVRLPPAPFLSSSPISSRQDGPILTFCTLTEIAIRLPTERVSRARRIPRDAARGDDPRPRFVPVGGRRVHTRTCPAPHAKVCVGDREIYKRAALTNERAAQKPEFQMPRIPIISASSLAPCLQINDHDPGVSLTKNSRSLLSLQNDIDIFNVNHHQGTQIFHSEHSF